MKRRKTEVPLLAAGVKSPRTATTTIVTGTATATVNATKNTGSAKRTGKQIRTRIPSGSPAALVVIIVTMTMRATAAVRQGTTLGTGTIPRTKITTKTRNGTANVTGTTTASRRNIETMRGTKNGAGATLGTGTNRTMQSRYRTASGSEVRQSIGRTVTRARNASVQLTMTGFMKNALKRYVHRWVTTDLLLTTFPSALAMRLPKLPLLSLSTRRKRQLQGLRLRRKERSSLGLAIMRACSSVCVVLYASQQSCSLGNLIPYAFEYHWNINYDGGASTMSIGPILRRV